jgi:hypothetical protein
MNRRIALMALVLALAVAACGEDDQTTGSGAASATSPPAGTATATADSGDGDSEAEREAEKQAGEGAAGKSCDEAGDLAGEPKSKPPADLALPGDAHVYESEGPFGKTERFFAAIDGEAADMPTRRDDASDILVENGYKLLSKDQEEGAEAEAHLSGKHDVDIQVITLCEGKLRIRYTVS